MRTADQLPDFVRRALAAGRSREEVRAVLVDAGWTEREVSAALGAWAESTFLPPVPRPRPFVSGREAFLYGLMFVALAVVAWHLASLSFHLIDRWLPDPAARGWYGVQSMRWSIASLVVFLPLFLMLNARAERIARDGAGRRSVVRRSFGYVTLFLASIALLGDLIVAIHAFLSGDLTARFLAKSVVVAVVAGVIFLYFRGEMDADTEE